MARSCADAARVRAASRRPPFSRATFCSCDRFALARSARLPTRRVLQPTIDSVRARASSRARFACAWLEAAPTPRACAPPVAGRHSPARGLCSCGRFALARSARLPTRRVLQTTIDSVRAQARNRTRLACAGPEVRPTPLCAPMAAVVRRSPRSGMQHRRRIPRDHLLLVGRHDEHRDAAPVAADGLRIARVRVRIELDAEPAQPLAYRRARLRLMLADARREHERVEAAERRREPRGLARDPEREQFERVARAGRRIGEQRARVAAHARHAEQARAVVQHLLDVVERPAERLLQMQHDARVERAAARGHRNAVERREAHAGVAAHARVERAQARAAAEMRGDDLAARNRRMPLAQPPGDVPVRQPMKTVALDACVEQRARQREAPHEIGLRAVKRGIERCDLRQMRPQMAQRADQPHALRLMQRRERHERRDRVERALVDAHRPVERVAAVHDAMADRHELVHRQVRVDPAERLVEHRVQIVGDGRGERHRVRFAAVRVFELQRRAVEIDLAAPERRGFAVRDAVEADLQRRRAGVEREQQRLAHDASAPARVLSATSFASAADAMRTRRLSARLVRMIGSRAPSTRPAASAPAKYISCFASMLPASRSGTSSTSASPATGDAMPFDIAATALTALSNASGPSTIAPAICPRAAITVSAAASSVDGIFGLTVSTAASTATRGRSTPSTCSRSTAFWQMSRFCSSVGAMLIAASVMRSGFGYAGTSIAYTWLMRRSVRSRDAGPITAASNSSVCRLPFISAATSPAPPISTARAAAAWLCSTASIGTPARSTPAASAIARIFACGPIRIGSIRFASRASIAARSASGEHG
ncbi:hypothetical protein BURPS1710b_A1059 [Burkholderia pseudomallei 1710b]|uniref:Uncharacterized protein n=1 Tax=Burkholderia pseudomallei (strain 1710b) TaxID=320372 RepID=Q3JJN6_BURP1|nr:hypothetical protein BURPS1710b_A1059 [Burkholderia pseudomallei 1710b]